MKIKIKELREGLNPLRLERKGPIADPEGFRDISGDLTIEKCGTTLRVKGILNFNGVQQCSRCLKDFSGSFSQPIEFFYRTGKLEDSRPGREVELNSDDLDVIAYSGAEIDIWPEIKEAMILAVPMKPLCSNDCQGICPSCGKDLNSGKCRCRKESIDPRWEVLLKLSAQKQGKIKK